MEYSIIDSQMRGNNRGALVKYAKDAEYSFYSEMLHDWHKNKGMNSAELFIAKTRRGWVCKIDELKWQGHYFRYSNKEI